jgi:hypothetical protein
MSTSSKDNNRSNMEIFYSDYGSDEYEGRTRFHMSEFAPWCSLLVGDKAPLGSDKWEERVKIVVKIVMLEAGYCDLTVYAFPPTMLAAIRANIDEGVDCLPRATMTIPKTPSSDIPAETVVPSAPRRGRRPDQYGGITVKEDPAKFYIQTLKNAIPAEHWFHTEAIAPYEERQMLLMGNVFIQLHSLPWKSTSRPSPRRQQDTRMGSIPEVQANTVARSRQKLADVLLRR